MSETILALLIAAGTLIFSILAYVYNTTKGAKKEAEHRGYITAQIDGVSKSIDELKVGMAKSSGETNGKIDTMLKSTDELRERVAKVEESTKSAHKRIDEITNNKKGA